MIASTPATLQGQGDQSGDNSWPVAPAEPDAASAAHYGPAVAPKSSARISIAICKLQGGSIASPEVIKQWARTYPADCPYLGAGDDKVSDRLCPKSGEIFGLILYPRSGKGNVTVFPKKRFLQISCSSDRLQYFLNAVWPWTTHYVDPK